MNEEVVDGAPSPEDDRAAWLKVRRTYLGATDIVAVLNMNPWRTPLQVYMEKTGLVEPSAPGAAAQRGIRLEPYVANMYRDMTGEKITKAQFARWAGEDGFLAASPDYQRLSDKRLVEIKTHSGRVIREYGPEGTDQVPARELMQVQWQMHVTGLTTAVDLIALFGVDDCRIYTIPYDGTIAGAMEAEARRFWAEHVAALVPPEPTAGDVDFLGQLYPESTQRQVSADGELEAIIDDLRDKKAALAVVQHDIDYAEARIKGVMGDAEVLHSRAGVFSWKQRKANPKWKDVAMDLGARQDDIDRHTPPVGPRVFITPFKAERAGA